MSIKSWLFGLFQKTPEFDIHAPSVKSEEEVRQQTKDAIEEFKEKERTKEKLAKIEEEQLKVVGELYSIMDKMDETEEEDWGEKVDEDGKTKK